MQRIVFLTLLAFILSTTFGQANKSNMDKIKKYCDIPEKSSTEDDIFPAFADTKNSPIKIIVSNDTLHQIESRILKIVLESYFHFTNIEFVNVLSKRNKMYIDSSNDVMKYIDDQERENTSFLINLDTHVPTLFTTHYDLVYEKGLISDVPGRYGILLEEKFIPSNITDSELDWKLFQVDSEHFDYFAVQPLPNDTFTTIFTRNCVEKCPVIITQSRYQYYNEKLKNFTSKNNLSVQIVIPNNESFFLFENPNYSSRFFVFSYSPSEITNNELIYKHIQMPPCKTIESNEGCLFHEVSRVKLLSKSMNELDERRLNGFLSKIEFDQTTEQKWLSKNIAFLTDSEKEKEYNDLAWDWVRSNTNTISQKWLPTNPKRIKLNLFIFTVKSNPVLQNVIISTLDEINSNLLTNICLYPYIDSDYCEYSERSIGNAIELTQRFTEAKADVIVGPWCSETLSVVEAIAINQQIPVINYAASGFDKSQRDPASMLFSVYGDMSEFSTLVPRFLETFGWERFATLTVKGETHTNYITKFNISNEEITDDIKNIQSVLDSIKENHRIIWIDVKMLIFDKVLCEAYEKQMTTENRFVWITPQSLTNLTFQVKMNNNCKCNCSHLESMLRNMLVIQRQPTVNDVVAIDWWEHIEKETKDTASLVFAEVAGYLHDSLWTVAKVIEKLEKMKPEVFALHDDDGKRPKAIVDTLRNFSMENGITGNIDFKSNNGSRQSHFNILQIQSNLTQHIIGTFNGQLQLNHSDMKWPKDVVFSDWPMCKVDGIFFYNFEVKCIHKTAVEVLVTCIYVFLITTGFFCYFYLKRLIKFNSILAEMGQSILKQLQNKKIPRENLTFQRGSHVNLLGQGHFAEVVKGTLKENVKGETKRFGWRFFSAKGNGEHVKDQEVKKSVAVKYLKNNYDFKAMRDILLEAEQLVSLKHRNIIQMEGICFDRKEFCIVLEFMGGGSLKSYVTGLKHIYFMAKEDIQNDYKKRLTKYAVDIARAIEYLKSKKKVHRDIACRNVLLHTNYTAKLADFGFCRDLSNEGSYTNSLIAELPIRWMAPEAVKKQYSSASDVWSFAVMIYEMIKCGEEPYQQFTNDELQEKFNSDHIPPIDLPTDICQQSPMLKGILERCWAKEPNDRPTPSDLVKFFEKYSDIIQPSTIVLENTENRLDRIERMFRRQISDDSGYVVSPHLRGFSIESMRFQDSNNSSGHSFEQQLLRRNQASPNTSRRYVQMQGGQTGETRQNEEYLYGDDTANVPLLIQNNPQEDNSGYVPVIITEKNV